MKRLPDFDPSLTLEQNRERLHKIHRENIRQIDRRGIMLIVCVVVSVVLAACAIVMYGPKKHRGDELNISPTRQDPEIKESGK